MLNQAAVDLGCNSTCVSQCAAAAADYTNQTLCIDSCLCYWDSTVRFPPVVANATPAVVATDATATATTPVDVVPQPVLDVFGQVINSTTNVANNSTVSPFIPPAVVDIINQAL